MYREASIQFNIMIYFQEKKISFSFWLFVDKIQNILFLFPSNLSSLNIHFSICISLLGFYLTRYSSQCHYKYNIWATKLVLTYYTHYIIQNIRHIFLYIILLKFKQKCIFSLRHNVSKYARIILPSKSSI